MENKKILIGKNGIKGSNCVVLGHNSGSQLKDSDEYIVILGDNIPKVDRSLDNVAVLGEKVIIGDTLFGKRINLKDVIKDFLKKLE